jgi:kynurenine 3-monooxygenase
MRDEPSQRLFRIPLDHVIAADGAGSALRHSLVASFNVAASEQWLEHGYKELTLPAAAHGRHQLHKNALHIWPRGGFMLIALPNLDGSFTVTLFLAQQGAESFATLEDATQVNAFFARHFADVAPLMPALASEFMQHPTGLMGTVRSSRWSVDDRLLLFGDAAHAITPFHGQGMNCAFEDCSRLNELLSQDANWSTVFAQFEHERRANTDAIAAMALENYLEMRDTVRDPKFALQKTLSLELERRFPERFVPRYSMVMFHDEIPYRIAQQRGAIQNDILQMLTRVATTLDQVDLTLAERLITTRLESIRT